MTIGKRIKELRAEKGITQETLAKAINCARASIYYWEKDLNEPTASAIIALANYFGVTADYILGRTDN